MAFSPSSVLSNWRGCASMDNADDAYDTPQRPGHLRPEQVLQNMGARPEAEANAEHLKRCSPKLYDLISKDSDERKEPPK